MTFSSRKEACIRLSHAEYVAETEASEALKLWADSSHVAALFRIDQYSLPVIAVKFKGFDRLGSARKEATFRLPKELYAEITFYGDWKHKTLTCVLDDIAGLPHNNAILVVLNAGSFKWLEKMGQLVHRPDNSSISWKPIKIKPLARSFTLQGLMSTCTSLLSPNSQWKELLLNQRATGLKRSDLTAGINAAAVAALTAGSRHGSNGIRSKTQSFETYTPPEAVWYSFKESQGLAKRLYNPD